MSRRIPNYLYCAALVSLPLVGVGSLELLGLPSVGMGIQPAVLFGSLAFGAAFLGNWRALVNLDAALPLALFLLLLVVGLSSTWTMDHAGLFGEAPWSKSTKQALQFVLYLCIGLTPALLLGVSSGGAELRDWERALSLGLLWSSFYGLIQAVDFVHPLPLMQKLDGFASSNPSIAAGSHELYLGHRFVGIPRIRSTACEPLYFGSYLLVALPIAVAAASRVRGWARAWRVFAALMGSVCFLMTFSRGAYAAAMLAFVMAGILWWRGGRTLTLSLRPIAASVGAALLIALMVGALSGQATWELPSLLMRRVQQTFASHDMSNLTRLFAWEAGWRAFLERPLVGHGWGSFGFLYYGLAPAGGAGAHFGWPVANGILLRLLAELGVLGTALAAWCHWPVFRRLQRLWLSPVAIDHGALLSLLWVIAAFQGLSHSQIQLPHLWVLGGFCVTLPRFRSVLV